MGWRWGRAPPHTFTKNMSKNRSATHFTPGLRPCIISSFLITNIPVPPSKNYPVVPLKSGQISRLQELQQNHLSLNTALEQETYVPNPMDPELYDGVVEGVELVSAPGPGLLCLFDTVAVRPLGLLDLKK